MRKKKAATKKIKLLGLVAISGAICLLNPSKANPVEAVKVGGSHIGTFEGSTTFTTTSQNGVNPGLFIEVMDGDGNLTQYESEEGMITIPDTKEGAYVTQAKLLGKTKYVDEDTGEVLDRFEEGRNLKLVSSESPGLTTKNKQTFIDFKEVSRGEGDIVVESSSDGREVTITTPRWIPISYMLNYEENQSYTIKFEYEATNEYVFDLYDVNGRNRMSFRSGTGAFSFDFMPESTDGRVIEIQNNLYGGYLKLSNVEFGLTSKKDEPYKTSVVSTSEDLELRGIGNVRDTLDLITGEVVQRVGELTLDSNGNWYWKWNDWEGCKHFFLNGFEDVKGGSVILSNRFNTVNGNPANVKVAFSLGKDDNWGAHSLVVTLPLDLLETPDVEGFKKWLSENPVEAQYIKTNNEVKTVDLTSDYYFQAVTDQNLQVNGNVLPMISSVTVPTEALTFVLNPNQEAGQQFIAPDFSITNNTLAPLRIELKSFEQTTDVLNDVLPDKYDSWEGLNKKQSQDIALALEPIPSEGWLSLNEGPRYVADHSNYALGEIKANSTVEFAFSALHGQSFVEPLTPQYRLTFIFDQK